MQLVSVLGAGLLVGTALAVIIPEGIRALFTAPASSDHQQNDSKLLYKFILSKYNNILKTFKDYILLLYVL